MRRVVKAAFLTLAAYLLQTCLMQNFRIGGVMGNLMIVNIAILTVSYGRKYAFASASITGILLEAMSSSVGALYVIFYPVAGFICAQFFADMTDAKREIRRNQNKSQSDLNPHLRILMDAAAVAALFEIVMLIYVSLSGIQITGTLILRALTSIFYTLFLAVVLMYPSRRFLGMYARRGRQPLIDERRQKNAAA